MVPSEQTLASPRYYVENPGQKPHYPATKSQSFRMFPSFGVSWSAIGNAFDKC